MQRRTWLTLVLVAATVAPFPAVAARMANGEVYAMGKAEAPLPFPLPLTGRRPPRFERDSWARATLRRHGLADIRGLGRVGDYWEAEARSGGKPVVVYLIDNGALYIRHYSRAAVAATFAAAG